MLSQQAKALAKKLKKKRPKKNALAAWSWMLGWAPGMERTSGEWAGGASGFCAWAAGAMRWEGGRGVVGVHAGARGDGPGGFGVGGRADRSAFADKPSERRDGSTKSWSKTRVR